MKESIPQPLLLPVSYWPARTGTYWWDDFRRDEVVKDFELASAAGVSHLQIALPWEVSQPHSEGVSPSLMRDLDSVLRVASDARLSIVASIAVASLFDVLTLPHWFYELSADEHSRPVRVMRRLFEDPLVVRGTGRLVDELTHEFGQHPSIEGWIIGDGMMSAAPPRSVDHVEQWLDRVSTTMRRHGRKAWHGVSARDVALSGSFRPRVLAESDFGVLVHLDWIPPWAHDARLWATFIASYIRSQGGLAPLLIGSARYPLPSTNAHEDTVIDTVRELGVAGAAGLIWPALLDYDPALRTRPPFNTARGEMTRGLLPVSPGLSPAARGWLEVTADPGIVESPSWLSLDDELRARDPEGFMRLAYDEFTT